VGDGDGLVLESGWLPPAEFDRLTAFAARDLPGLTVTRDAGPGHRGVDPTIVVAVVSGVTALLLPFVAKLAERLFAAEPRSSLTIEVSAGGVVVIDGTLAPDVRAARLDAAVGSGATRIRIEA
jgi:hypothetical protein